MIAHLHGTLLSVRPAQIVLDVHGVGYRIFITLLTLGKLPPLHTSCRLWISHVIREQSQALYGFLQPQECTLFETLLAVNGIGPKLALSILGHLTPQEFAQALAGGDTAVLSKVPGVGKKMAQRLIVEMNGAAKLTEFAYSTDEGELGVNGLQRQAVSALLNLGYNELTAQRAVKKALQTTSAPFTDLAALIACALQST